MYPAHQIHRVCTRCTQRRKKCDKKLPQCSFCERNGLSCQYPTISSPLQHRPSKRNALDNHHFIDSETHTENIGAQVPQQQPQQQQQRTKSSEPFAFPRLYFLDAGIFQRRQFELPRDNLPVPSYLSNFVGNSASIRCLGANYFNTVHTWMPIISRRHFYQHLVEPLSQSRADVALLIVAMRLITWSPPPSTGSIDFKSDMYRAAKQFYIELETTGLIRLPILQSGILIALYEFGHAIYPSAYFTVGACARYGAALGIDRAATLSADKSLSWVEVEERRRVWWAVLILDRSINLGSPLHSLATEDPKSTHILPGDDDLFDQGTSPPQEIHTVSSTSSLEMGRFARFAQATYLLGRVLRHVSDPDVDKEFHANERIQLYRTLFALVSLSIFEGQARNLEFCTQTATCYCALLVLQESHYPDDEEAPAGVQHELHSVISAEAVARKTAAIADNISLQGSMPCQTVSPFIFHLLYRSAGIFTRISRQANAVEDSNKVLAVLKQSLELLRCRWGSASAYIEILEV